MGLLGAGCSGTRGGNAEGDTNTPAIVLFVVGYLARGSGGGACCPERGEVSSEEPQLVDGEVSLFEWFKCRP